MAGALAAGSAAVAAPPKIGQPAPDFHATLFDGSQVSLADFKGQVLILNFWATWCGPCKQELPLLNAYYKIDKPHGLRVLAVATQDSLTPWELKPLATKLEIPLVKRMKGPYEDLKAVPTNYIIDRAGVVRYAKAAAFSLDDLNALLVPLLEEAPPGAAPAQPGQATP